MMRSRRVHNTVATPGDLCLLRVVHIDVEEHPDGRIVLTDQLAEYTARQTTPLAAAFTFHGCPPDHIVFALQLYLRPKLVPDGSNPYWCAA